MNVEAGTVSLNIFYEWLLLMVLSIMMNKYLCLKKTYPIHDKGSKTIPYLRQKWPKSILYL